MTTRAAMQRNSLARTLLFMGRTLGQLRYDGISAIAWRRPPWSAHPFNFAHYNTASRRDESFDHPKWWIHQVRSWVRGSLSWLISLESFVLRLRLNCKPTHWIFTVQSRWTCYSVLRSTTASSGLLEYTITVVSEMPGA